MQKASFIDLGLIDYKAAWNYQEELFKEVIAQKIANRNLPEPKQEPTENWLLFCEHPHVYTLGKTGSEDHLLLDKENLRGEITYYKINRGGDITYHGPGQIVGYPIFDLDNFFTDIGKYLRCLEEAVIQTLADYSIAGGRLKGATGVWIDPDDPTRARKICAIGVRTSRWVTMHGFALNVNTDLEYFKNIIPCGIEDKDITSIEKEMNGKANLDEVKSLLKDNLAKVFEIEFTEKQSTLNNSVNL